MTTRYNSSHRQNAIGKYDKAAVPCTLITRVPYRSTGYWVSDCAGASEGVGRDAAGVWWEKEVEGVAHLFASPPPFEAGTGDRWTDSSTGWRRSCVSDGFLTLSRV